MSKLAEIICRPFSLLVSLPLNDPDMAIAAQEGGADGIKVHINVEHFASGTKFGTWQEEKEKIKDIIKSVSIPVGLLPGAKMVASQEEILEAQSMGIDFLDSFAHDLPLYLWNMNFMGYLVAVNKEYSPTMIKSLEFAGVDAIEATILTHDEYGKDLTMRDFALYHGLAQSTTKPILIPTQKKIRPEEIPLLKKAGARGIIIGAIVTGKTREGVEKATKEFREAIGN